MEKISKSLKRRYESVEHHASGSKLTDEHKGRISDSLKAHWQENEHWSLGLTSETDERIRYRGKRISEAFLSGSCHWSYDDEKKIVVGKKISETKKRNAPIAPERSNWPDLSKGHGWNKGLSADTDPRIANISLALKKKYSKESHPSSGKKFGITARRISIDDFAERLGAFADTLELVGDINSILQLRPTITTQLKLRCIGCGQVHFKCLHTIEHGWKCRTCNPRSKPEGFVHDHIRSLGYDVITTRQVITPYELDAFVPKRNVAFECNGLYWHSDAVGQPDRYYHQRKTELCRENGIRLVHLFEDEIHNKWPIVQSVIEHALHCTPQRLGARKCELRQIGVSLARPFFDSNHLDGYTPAKITFALISDGQIVSAISLRKPFVGNHSEGAIEIARACSAIGYNVQGGLSRLISHAKTWAHTNGYDRIVTYADQRVCNDVTGYERIGFTKVCDTGVTFWWTDYNERFGRLTYRACDGKSEKQVAAEAGVTKIWGCKNVLLECKIQ